MKKILMFALLAMCVAAIASCSKYNVDCSGDWSNAEDRLRYISVDDDGFMTEYYLSAEYKYSNVANYGVTDFVTFKDGVLHISTKAVTTKDNDGVKAGTEITFKPRWVVTSDKDTQIRDGMAFWGTAKVGDVKKKGKKLYLPSIGAGHGAYEYDRLNKIEMD